MLRAQTRLNRQASYADKQHVNFTSGASVMRLLAAICLFAITTSVSASACNHPARKQAPIPPVGESIERTLKGAAITASDLLEVRELQAQIAKIAGSDEEHARELEVRAMKILGHQKAWLRCGPGTFTWLTENP